MMSIADTYTMVDEVNEALSNYTPITKLDDYALKTDIPAAVNVEIQRKKDTTCTKEAIFEKNGNIYMLDLSYIEGTYVTIKYEEVIYSFAYTVDE